MDNIIKKARDVKGSLGFSSARENYNSKKLYQDAKDVYEYLVSMRDSAFETSFDIVADQVHQNAVDKGFWEDDGNDGEKIALMHSELSELLEGLREGNPESVKIPGFSIAEEEGADVVIRIMDYFKKRGWRLGRAVLAKHEYNTGRPYKHGKKF